MFPAFSRLSVGLALAALCGLSLPFGHGWLVPAGVVVVLAVVAHRMERSLATPGVRPGFAAALELSWRERVVLDLGVLASAVVLCTLCARGVAALVVAYPGALVGLLVALFGSVVVGRTRGVLRLAVTAACFVIVPWSAMRATVFEAEGVDARGYAHSGPVLGIHPFQATAVVVDGFGPFDLPINDYVEPDASRGYGAEELGEAIELALHRIAALHFADGPLRAKKAFADARVEPFRTDPVPERLTGEAYEDESRRFKVYSGTWGRGSRVQFVCPGARNDPRPLPDDAITHRMCPDKYASEASAGLGLTGRWTGYGEARGNERVSLGRWLGWTRTDDVTGRQHQKTEQQVLAFLAIVCFAALVAGRGRASEGVALLGGGYVLVAAAGVVGLAAVHLPEAASVFWPRSYDPTEALVSPLAWGAAIAALFGARPWTRPSASVPPASVPPAWQSGLRVGLVAVVLLAATVAALVGGESVRGWVDPELYQGRSGLMLEAWVRSVSDHLARLTGHDVLLVEGAVAVSLAVVLVGVAVDALRHVTALADPATLGGAAGEAAVARSPGRPGWALAVCLVLAVGLVFSSKSLGASALLPAVLGLSLLGWTGLFVASSRRAGAWILHGLAIVVAMVLVVEGLLVVPRAEGALLLYTALLAGIVVAHAVFGVRRSGPPESRSGGVSPGPGSEAPATGG